MMHKQKRVFQIRNLIALLLFAAVIMAGCGAGGGNDTAATDNGGSAQAAEVKPKIIATLFPQFDFTRAIAGDLVEVALLLPPGVESHAYEPTPRDIAGIAEADAFLFTGEVMEPWATKLIGNLKGSSVKVVDLSRGITLITSEAHGHEEDHSHDEDEHEEEGEAHPEGAFDPHIWLDPNNAKIMVTSILEALVEMDPANAATYKGNAARYLDELTALDEDYQDLFAKAQSKTIYYGGHFVFGYFAKAYGLTTISPYDGFSPDAEPTPRRIAELIDAMANAPFKVIYYEELVDPKIAKLVSQETGAQMVLLHGAHNVSKQELESGVTYLSLMKENLEKLKLGMGYRE